MTDVLSLPDAERLAERTLAAIDAVLPVSVPYLMRPHFTANRERVASDLALLREAAFWREGGNERRIVELVASLGLRRTAALYGVDP